MLHCPARFFLIFLAILILTPFYMVAQDTNQTSESNSSAEKASIKPGRILGRVFDDDTGEALSGVTVVFEDRSIETKTDLEGRYRQSNLVPGNYSILFFKEGYTRTRIPDIILEEGRTKLVDLPMVPDYSNLESLDAFEINAADLENTEIELLSTRREAIVLSDSIGSDFFSKAGVGDVAAAMTKVTGANVVGGKYAVIRGLGDRYSNTTLNSMPIPSSDPSKRAVQLDIFPTDLVESIVTTKSFTPDKPGDYTGGNVNVITKSLPEQLEIKAGLSTKFKPDVFGKEILIVPNSKLTDLGKIRSQNFDSVPAITKEMQNPRSKMDLNEKYNLGKELHTGFLPLTTKANLDRSFNLSIGNTLEFENDILVGVFTALSQDTSTDHIDSISKSRYALSNGSLKDLPEWSFIGQKSSETVNFNGLIGASILINENNEISIVSMLNRSAENSASSQRSYLNHNQSIKSDSIPNALKKSTLNDPVEDGGWGLNESSDGNVHTLINELESIEREITSNQIHGKHQISDEEKLNWSFSQTSTMEKRPDFRQFVGHVIDLGEKASGSEFVSNGQTRKTWWNYVEGNPISPEKRHSGIEEDGESWKIDYSTPIDEFNSAQFGFSGSTFKRKGFGRRFSLNYTSSSFNSDQWLPGDPTLVYDNLNNWDYLHNKLTETNSGKDRTYYSDQTLKGSNILNYSGEQRVEAYYLMNQTTLADAHKLVFGVRKESTEMNAQTDPNLVPSIYAERKGQIIEDDFLPAISYTWEHGDRGNMNLRFAIGQTIARPTFYEFTPVRISDNALGITVEGNPDLVQSNVDNYDIRWEWFPTEAEIISLGYFYKDFENPIVNTALSIGTSPLYSWTNAPAGTIQGIEFEIRKEFLGYFNSGLNFTKIEAEISPLVDSEGEVLSSNTTFVGQPEIIYNINAGVSLEKYRVTSNVFYNYVGEYLTNVSTSDRIPDLFQDESYSLDFNLAAEVMDNWKLKFSATNLLNPVNRIYYSGTKSKTAQEYKKGRAFGLSLSWSY